MEVQMFGEVKNVIQYWMEGEINTFIQAWITAYLSLTYAYFAAKILPTGAARLAAFLPVVALLLLLPLHLHSMHLIGITSFFLSWLATFKLLMLAFSHGPLSIPSLSLSRFIALASLPIKLQLTDAGAGKIPKKGHKSLFNYAVKSVLFVLLLNAYDYEDRFHPKFMLAIHSFHIYLCLELMCAAAAAAARGALGAELEPQFDEPYLSASLQEFWGRRWNLMVTRILRPAVYLPVKARAAGIVGSEWAPLPAVMAAFAVSGMMHELIFYYFGLVRPTWEITWFFLLHGASLAAEIAAKKAVGGRWRPPRVVGTVLTVGFVMVTSFWLFYPQLLRCRGDERGLADVAAVAAFVKDVVRALFHSQLLGSLPPTLFLILFLSYFLFCQFLFF